MAFTILLTHDAEQDLEELEAYIARHDSPAKAAQVLARIERAVLGLSHTPQRGATPRELRGLGIQDFREVFFKPYRIIYRVAGERVIVVLIADGRRDMQALLQRRLLGA